MRFFFLFLAISYVFSTSLGLGDSPVISHHSKQNALSYSVTGAQSGPVRGRMGFTGPIPSVDSVWIQALYRSSLVYPSLSGTQEGVIRGIYGLKDSKAPLFMGLFLGFSSLSRPGESLSLIPNFGALASYPITEWFTWETSLTIQPGAQYLSLQGALSARFNIGSWFFTRLSGQMEMVRRYGARESGNFLWAPRPIFEVGIFL